MKSVGIGAVLLTALALIVVSCSGSEGETVANDPDAATDADGSTRFADTGRTTPDTATPDTGAPLDLPRIPEDGEKKPDLDTPEPGELGAPCEQNSDCEGGFCVPSDIGDICTITCIDDCPQDWVCKGIPYTDPDTIFVCMPSLELACLKNGVCEAMEVESQTCGNCGERERTCQENCQWGEWSNCFGEGECVAGVDQEEACGNCGLRVRQCSDECLWSKWTECTGEGACSPGEQETEACGMCSLRTRTCTEECQWSEWSNCTGGGECEPGTDQTEACGMCGSHLRICLESCFWSDWGECTNEGVCTPGEQEAGDCGMCGSQSRQCTDECQWSSWGACEGQGPCLPGEVDDEACGDCGSRERVCSDQCQWGPWGNCLGEGICTPGEKLTEACGNCGTREKSCTNQCEWSGWGPCEDQGVCGPEDMETAACGNCGTKHRFCADTCVWGPWGSCANQGVCSPGDTQPCNLCGTKACTNACAWGNCNIGYVDGYEENDSEGASYELPGITDNNGDTQTLNANINPASDPDWYDIHISDTTFHNIDPKVTLSVPAGQTYKLCVTYKCDESSNVYSQCKTITTSDNVSLDVGGCEGFFSGDDDSGTAYIQVLPLSSGSCATYTLKIEA